MRKMLSRNQTIELVNEAIESGEIHCDPSTEVKVGDINSESATAGKVIVADGDGGAEWGTIQAGMDVVELASSSGTLSDSDFAKVSGNNCIIKYQERFYNFSQVTSAYLYYESYFYSSRELTIYRISIDIDSKTYNYSTEVMGKVETTTLQGTESTINALRIGSTRYKLGEPVVAYEGVSMLDTGVAFADWTLHRGIKDGNVLWIVICGKIVNNSGAQNTPYNICKFTLPSEIASKIYRADGSKVSESYTLNEDVLSYIGTQNTNNKTFIFKSFTANELQIVVSAAPISDGSSARFDLRVPIFLDIGA